jgi:hypothetical protein
MHSLVHVRPLPTEPISHLKLNRIRSGKFAGSNPVFLGRSLLMTMTGNGSICLLIPRHKFEHCPPSRDNAAGCRHRTRCYTCRRMCAVLQTDRSLLSDRRFPEHCLDCGWKAVRHPHQYGGRPAQWNVGLRSSPRPKEVSEHGLQRPPAPHSPTSG